MHPLDHAETLRGQKFVMRICQLSDAVCVLNKYSTMHIMFPLCCSCSCIVLCYLPPNAVEVRLTNTAYTTSEADGSVDICAGVTDGDLRGRNLTVTVTTMEGSAMGQCTLMCRTDYIISTCKVWP